jgi:demethylmenaquinone methyltransferase/2-methoxy-6-polyprenyl-1,4-benzoquinol methylase
MSDALPQGAAKTQAVRTMFDTIASRYELVNKVMTFGLDARWRRRAVRDLRLPAKSVILDVAAGTGDFTRELARQDFTPVATDLSFGMLDAAKRVADKVQSDATELPFTSGAFDGLTCGYALRNFTDLQGVFNEMGRVVRAGGRISFLEVAEPHNRFLRFGFRLWFRRAVPFLGSLLSDRKAYAYLPKSTAYLPEVETMIKMLNTAGFTAVNHRYVFGGLSQQFVATRRA